MTPLGTIRWIALALVGLAVAAGVSVAASQLVSQRIGLAAEPVSAGKELAPPGREQPAAPGHGKPGQGDSGHHGHGPRPPTSTTTPSTTTTTTSTTTTSTATAPPASTTPPPTSGGGGGGGEGPDD